MNSSPSSSPEFVEFHAADGRELQGFVYSPPDPAEAMAAIVHAHGKGANFYSGPSRTLPLHTSPDRFIHLALNMRCHDLGYIRVDTSGHDGGMWERIDDGATDIEAGVRYLRERTGSLPMFVAGHSAGGYFLGDWSARNPDVTGRIFLSPLSTVQTYFASWFPDRASYEQARKHATELATTGRGKLLIALPGPYYAISANSLLERMTERTDRWFDGVHASDAPVLMIWGGLEVNRHAEWKRVFERLKVPRKQRLEVPDANHVYFRQEAVVGRAISRFVDATLGM